MHSQSGEGLVPQEPSQRPVPKRLRQFAKNMRHEPTDAERAMWRLLRDRRLSTFKFRRQVPFKSYILDFVCFDKHLVIDLAGSQLAESQRDATRDAVLSAEGFSIARYWNNEEQQQTTSVLE